MRVFADKAVGYGIPDFGSLPSATNQQRESIGRMAEDIIGRSGALAEG